MALYEHIGSTRQAFDRTLQLVELRDQSEVNTFQQEDWRFIVAE